MIIDNVAVYKNEILGSLAWKRDDIANSDWRIKLPPQVLDELENLISPKLKQFINTLNKSK